MGIFLVLVKVIIVGVKVEILAKDMGIEVADITKELVRKEIDIGNIINDFLFIYQFYCSRILRLLVCKK